MKYQVIKNLRNTTKLIALVDSLNQAKEIMGKNNARFQAISYIGSFPVYLDDKGKTYSIQGLADIGVVCQLPQREIESYNC